MFPGMTLLLWFCNDVSYIAEDKDYYEDEGFLEMANFCTLYITLRFATMGVNKTRTVKMYQYICINCVCGVTVFKK